MTKAFTPLRFAALLGAVALGACNSAPPPPPPKPAAAAAPKPVEKALEPVKTDVSTPVQEYVYSPVGKRDPFRSLIEDLERAPGGDPSPNCGPLCKWELEQLKLVAVISGVSNPLGMVEDPKGRGFVVRRGTFMGKRNGKVTQIRSGEIVVTEIFKDQRGTPHLVQKAIKLPADKNAPPADEDQNLLGPEVAQ
jgi:type IV pilus assembly protein PilP